MSPSNTLLTDLHSGVCTLTLNRPRANAFNFEMIAALQEALALAGSDPAARCVVISGSGGIFSAGQDVTAFGDIRPEEIRYHLERTYNPLVLQIRRLEKPVLAGIQGTAAGAALGVALACDLRLAAEDARFVFGFLGIGLAPDSGVSLFLPTLIGLGRAAEAAFSNQPIGAAQALQWGLVNRVTPTAELAGRAFEWAAQLARGPVGAMALAKRAFNQAMYPNLEAVLDHEAHLQSIAGGGEEHRIGVRAFLEKRPPDFWQP